MNHEIKVDLGSVLPYFEERFRQLIGRDHASVERTSWFKALQETAIKKSSEVYCVGMREALPFDSIYQPTRLLRVGRTSNNRGRREEYGAQNRAARSILRAKDFEEQSISLRNFLQWGDDAIILAGPGWGKTTFVHHIFRSTGQRRTKLPVLITLRRPTAVQDLDRFVEVATDIKAVKKGPETLLLVDGYDEIGVGDRRRVSEALLRFQALGIGHFYLTCREYYEVYDLPVSRLRIDRFNSDDMRRFVSAFLSAYGSPLDPETVVDDLEQQGFSEFLAHPLLLTLACILKTSSSREQPRSALRLLERALDVLYYRWDEQKGIDREQLTPLDGRDRIQVLKEIAYRIKTPYVSKSRAEGIARKELDRMIFDRVDPRQVLIEIARFYGILVPTDDGWEFVHRTIHDFLAAQRWVESGDFARARHYEWDARTAYAACLVSDSTEIIEAALAHREGLPAVTEIIGNTPSFDIGRVGQAIIDYFSEPGRVHQLGGSEGSRVVGRLETDFLLRGSSRFLERLFEQCCTQPGSITSIIAGYCLIALYRRRYRLDHTSYNAGLSAFGRETFGFRVPGVGEVQLGFLKPKRAGVPRLLQDWDSGNSSR